jgi:DNA polymerase III delta prime subunit
MITQDIPWVEKYRPTKFNNIVLDPHNKMIMRNIIQNNSFPNILFYGPPGTGKTTTIINLIADYQKKNNQCNKELIIHLNASDERGIDIIRNNINQFVNSKTLFNSGTKFIILDEVDSMTKNAQQALKYLLQCYNKGVRFCLICNYISRIDESLQNEFLRLRFNQLPEDKILGFLEHISREEGLDIPKQTLCSIQHLYKSDIRSMINYLQSNKNKDQIVITDDIWSELLTLITLNDKELSGENLVDNYLTTITEGYNIDIKNIIKEFLNFIIRNKDNLITKEFLRFCEILMHMQDVNVTYLKNYFIIKCHKLFSSSNCYLDGAST